MPSFDLAKPASAKAEAAAFKIDGFTETLIRAEPVADDVFDAELRKIRPASGPTPAPTARRQGSGHRAMLAGGLAAGLLMIAGARAVAISTDLRSGSTAMTEVIPRN